MSDENKEKEGSKVGTAGEGLNPTNTVEQVESPEKGGAEDQEDKLEVLEGSPNFDSTYIVDGKEHSLGDLVAEAAGETPVAEWNALDQKDKDARIQAVLEELIPQEEIDEDKNEAQKLGLPRDVVYAKSFPAGTFPGDTAVVQRELAKEAGSHCLSNGTWKTGSKKNKDGSIMHYILPGEES